LPRRFPRYAVSADTVVSSNFRATRQAAQTPDGVNRASLNGMHALRQAPVEARVLMRTHKLPLVDVDIAAPSAEKQNLCENAPSRASARNNK
jgi:hypothetical protein